MRIATFNVESLDSETRDGVPLHERIELLRPQLERLDADILCLQEVNGQRQPGARTRSLAALGALIEGTRYADHNQVATASGPGQGIADVHNLVLLSRFPINTSRDIRNEIVPVLRAPDIANAVASDETVAMTFDRPLQYAEITLPGARTLHVFNAHLRAPLAAEVQNQKQSAFVWKSTQGWAEGYFRSAMKRVGQALELRLAVDRILDGDPHALIAIAGDLNAEDHESPLRIIVAAEEDTGNGLLAHRALVPLERALPADRRYSVLHHGRPQMLDHILASRTLLAHVRTIEVHNETLGDELVGYGKVRHAAGSYHAPLVAEFAFD